MTFRIALFTVSFAVFGTSQANHLPGGNITYRCTGGNYHEITLTLYRECSGSPMIPQTLQLSNDCGVTFSISNLLPVETLEISPLCTDSLVESTCNGGTSVGILAFIYRTTVFLSPCASWTFGWAICCRNTSINVQNTPGLWIEARLNNAIASCDASPVFNELPLPFVCVGQPVSYDCGTVDTDGNTLRYSFIDARFSSPVPTSVNYMAPHTGAVPFTGMVIDSLTGMVTFTPTLIGYIVTAVQVDSYNAAGVWIGSVMRDYPFVVQACSNAAPPIASGGFTGVTGTATLEDDRTVRVCSGSTFCVQAVFSDGDAGQTLELTSNVGTLFPDATFEVSGTNPSTANICWTGIMAEPGTYYLTIAARDNACPVRGEQHYVYRVIVDDAAYAGVNTSVTVCSSDPPVDLFDALNGDPDTGGAFTEVSPSVYHYVVDPIGDCPADSSVLTIVTVQAPNAGVNNAISICQNNVPIFMTDSLLGTPDPGGTWGAPCGFTASPWFDPSSGVGGTIVYTVCTGAPCAQDVASLTITVLPFSDPACIGLGMAHIAREVLLLFPNPSNGVLALRNTAATRVDLTDMQGRIAWSVAGRVTEGDWIISLPASVANGPYLLRLFEGDRSSTYRFELLR